MKGAFKNRISTLQFNIEPFFSDLKTKTSVTGGQVYNVFADSSETFCSAVRVPRFLPKFGL